MDCVQASNNLDYTHGEIIPVDLAISLVFGHRFSQFTYNKYNDSKYDLNLLLTCKSWNMIVTNELRQALHYQFFSISKFFTQVFGPESMPKMSLELSEDVSTTYRECNLASLYHLRKIQKWVDAEMQEMLTSTCLLVKKEGFIF
jgi:hypothetical protein